MITETELQLLADEFLGIFRRGELERVSSTPIGSLSLEEAYRVQDLVIERRLADHERVAGYKVGCTSEAVRHQFGLTEPISGRLMYPHIYHSEATLNYRDFTGCAVEPEFVLWIGKEVTGERLLDDSFLRSAIDGVSVGIEVHNFHFWHGKPTSQELIASNGLHACLVIGRGRHPLKDIDLGMEGVGIWIREQLQASGIGYEIMDHPLSSLRWLAGQLHDRGQNLLPGQWVIPGSPVRLVNVPPSASVQAAVTSLGSVRAHFAARDQSRSS